MHNNKNLNINLDFYDLYISTDIIEANAYFLKMLKGLESRDKELEVGDIFSNNCETTISINRLSNLIVKHANCPGFNVTINGLDALMAFQSILSVIFNLSEFKSGDTVVKKFLKSDQNNNITGQNLIYAILFTTTETTLLCEIAKLASTNPDLLLCTCLSQIWCCTGTQQSSINREISYQLASDTLNRYEDVNIPMLFVHGYFMNSSYGFSLYKDEFKYFITSRIKKNHNNSSSLTSHNFQVIENNLHSLNKPVMLVVLEAFNPHHSVYRVLGKSLYACKKYFNLVSVEWPGYVNNIPNDFFDTRVILSGLSDNFCIDEYKLIANTYNPRIVYFPSVGMTPWTIYFSSIRVSNLQIASVGHGSTTFSPSVDYFAIENDIAGDPGTYSEKLILLEPGSMPFIEPANIIYKPNQNVNFIKDCTDIVVCSSLMKINYKLLELCKDVQSSLRNHSKIKFHFLLGGTSPSIHTDMYKNLIKSYIDDCAIMHGMPFQDYIDYLSNMDISLSPFPYGNMNGLIDCCRLGVVPLAMKSPHLHGSIDAGMIKRMQLPNFLISNSVHEYKMTIIKLVLDTQLRTNIRLDMLQNKKWDIFYKGIPDNFASILKNFID